MPRARIACPPALLLSALALLGCTEHALVCRTHEDCPNPTAAWCVETESVSNADCQDTEEAAATECLALHRGRECRCVVGRAPWGLDGGTPGLRTAGQCFKTPLDAGPEPGFDTVDPVPKEIPLFAEHLIRPIATRVRQESAEGVHLQRLFLLGFESLEEEGGGLRDHALVWVQFWTEGASRFALADFTSPPSACDFSPTSVRTSTAWVPWASFPSPPSPEEIASFLAPAWTTTSERERLRAALRLDARWAELGYANPLVYAPDLPVATLDCR